MSRAVHIITPGQILGLSSVAGLMLMPLQQASAQESSGTGGQTFGFTVSEQIEAARNLSLTPGDDATTLQAITTFAFSFDDTTRISDLGVDAAIDLRVVDGPSTDSVDIDIDNPRISLSYQREAASARLDLTARYVVNDVAFIRPLTDFIDAGLPVLPEDFDDLTGSGTRTTIDLDTQLSVRDDAPFGLTFSAGVNDISYSDVTDPALTDNQRLRAGIEARFDISLVLQATAGLSYGRLDEAGSIDESLTLSAGAALARPDGSYGLSLVATDSDGDRQVGFSLSREIEFRNAALSASFGLTRSAEGETFVTGALDYAFSLPAGAFTVAFDRDVTLDGDTTNVLTSLSLGASRTLTPDLDAALSLGIAQQQEGGETIDIADLGASIDYALSPDWSVAAGASYQLRDDADGRADAQSLSLTVTRSFGARN